MAQPQKPNNGKKNENPDGKTNAERFKEIASQRLFMVGKYCKLLQNCANTSNYEYNVEQVKKIEKILLENVTEVIESFRNKKASGTNKIEL